ncbi:MAG: histidinol dehydrogenase [Flavobacteriales bacterium]|nr:histidinol dehydrogenase [Flavobacteriales bacterium]
MKVIKYPDSCRWNSIVQRPVSEQTKLNDIVTEIIEEVKAQGDQSLLRYAKKLDGATLDNLVLSDEEIEQAVINEDLKDAIKLAKNNIEKFHKNQLSTELTVETTSGVKCWRKNIAIEKVGLYIPGGSAPLFSTVLMLAIPARLAGCKEIILCTPPNRDGKIDPAILFTAKLTGIKKIFKVGGAQAIAAMAHGTESIPQVYKIFGPGNQFVTKAKEMVQQSGVAIDMPAGPSEVLVIADESCNPKFVAADLLSQAEHGADSQVVLLSDKESVVVEINAELELQLTKLPRKEITEKALENSFAVILNSLEECMALSNLYAPEHLIITTEKNELLINQIANAGSVFIGKYSCESAGDYASGTNHTLPTNGYSRNYSGVSMDSFMKKVTFQELTAEGIKNIGPAVEKMAEAEHLFAHKNAVTIRLQELNNV